MAKISLVTVLAGVCFGASVFAAEVPVAQVRLGRGQEYVGWSYRVNAATEQVSAQLNFRRWVVGPPFNNRPDVPRDHWRQTSITARITGARYDVGGNRIVFTTPEGRETVCATTESRRRLGRWRLYIHPTGACSVVVRNEAGLTAFSFKTIEN